MALISETLIKSVCIIDQNDSLFFSVPDMSWADPYGSTGAFRPQSFAVFSTNSAEI